MSRAVFVTGGSGFVGAAAIRALAGEGMAVRALSRRPESDALIRQAGGEPVRGALEDITPRHMAGAEIVIHAAARVQAWGRHADFARVNVEGTRRLLAAARQAGVRRFIHIGTEAALFVGRPLCDIAEDDLPLALRSPFPYARSKALAERLVRTADDPAAGLRTIVLRPRMIWGPGDRTLLPTLSRMVAAGRFVWVDHGRARTNTTHIANLVHAIRLALTGGAGGRAYFIHDGEVQLLRDFLTRLAATRGLTLPARSVPRAVIEPLAAGVETLWRLFAPRREPPVSRMVVALMATDCILRLDAARRELGYEPQVTVEEGLAALARTGSA